MFEKIILAVDGSEHSQRATKYAQGLAQRFESTIWLVHIFPHTLDLLSRDEYERLVASREAAGQKILDKAREQFDDPSLDVHEELLEGPEAEAILTVAATRQADLIVMGTRGFSSLKGLLLGSVSQKVIQHATCPVMVVQ
jgi:nucleotide-binding universal stress UspA family protein